MNLHKRLAGVLTGLVCTALLASCTPHSDGSRPVTITDIGDTSGLFSPPIQTDTGWETSRLEAMIPARDLCTKTNGDASYFKTYNYNPEDTSPAPPNSTTTLASMNLHDGSIRWARKITPEMHTHYYYDKSATPQRSLLEFQECASTALISNEKYLAFYLRPWMTSEGSSNISDQRMNIVVLDTETGNEVRTVEVTGIVLGHALTNDSLAVETAENFYPADTGKLNIFSLENPQEKPTTIHTNRWLTGATNNSLLLSQQNTDENYSGSKEIYTLTTLSTAGEEKATIAGVAAIHPGGWIERFKDPETAATIFQTTQEETQRKKELDALPRDLVNLDTGTTFDITGLSTTEVILPTSPGILLRTATTTEKDGMESTTYTATSWLPATPDATELRTDDMQHIEGEVASEPIHMGDKVR